MMLGDRKNVLWMNGDDPDIQSLFSNMTSTRLNAIIGTNEVVVIDEAQRIEGIGLRIKLITDQIPAVQVKPRGIIQFFCLNTKTTDCPCEFIAISIQQVLDKNRQDIYLSGFFDVQSFIVVWL